MTIRKQKKSNDQIDKKIQLLYNTYKYIYNISLSYIRTSATSQLRDLLPDSRLLFGKQKVISKALLKASKNDKFCKKIDTLLFTNENVEKIKELEVFDFYRANDIVDSFSVFEVKEAIEGYTEDKEGKHLLKKAIEYVAGSKISSEDAKVLRMAGKKMCKLSINVIDCLEINKE